MDRTLYPALILTGLIIGSFLNVVIHRVPAGLSLWRPASHCPKCTTPLRWFHNVPIWGYLIQRGRCTHCKLPIPLVYPLVEMGSAAILCVMYSSFGLSLVFAKLSFLALVMLALTLIDFRYHIIPNKIIAFSLPFAIAFVFAQGELIFVEGMIGGLTGGLGLWAIAAIGRMIYKKDAVGGGDIKLAILLGIFLGWEALLVTFFVAFLIMAIVGWIAIALKKMARGAEMPMAPYLTAGFFITILFGHELIHLYFHWIVKS